MAVERKPACAEEPATEPGFEDERGRRWFEKRENGGSGQDTQRNRRGTADPQSGAVAAPPHSGGKEKRFPIRSLGPRTKEEGLETQRLSLSLSLSLSRAELRA